MWPPWRPYINKGLTFIQLSKQSQVPPPPRSLGRGRNSTVIEERGGQESMMAFCREKSPLSLVLYNFHDTFRRNLCRVRMTWERERGAGRRRCPHPPLLWPWRRWLAAIWCLCCSGNRDGRRRRRREIICRGHPARESLPPSPSFTGCELRSERARPHRPAAEVTAAVMCFISNLGP